MADDSFYLFARWLVDGTGGAVKDHALVRVEHGVIRWIRTAQVAALPQQGILRFPRHTILPPLVDSHVHLSMSAEGDPETRKRRRSATFDWVRPVIEDHLKQHMSHGVLAVRDGGDGAGHVLRFKREYHSLKGIPVQIQSAGKAWRSPGRYGELIGRAPMEGESLAEGVARVGPVVDQVKIVNSGLNSLVSFGKETAPQFRLEELRDVVRVARPMGRKIMIHANGTVPVQVAVDAGCDSVEHGFFMGSQNLKRMRDQEVFWVPTAYTMKAYSEHLPPDSLESRTAARNLEHQLEQVSHAREKGVPIALGTDAGSLGVPHGPALREEMALLLSAGYSLEEVVRCATWAGARLLGLEDALGSLKPGMPATFLVVEGDPSRIVASRKRPVRVFQNGRTLISTP